MTVRPRSWRACRWMPPGSAPAEGLPPRAPMAAPRAASTLTAAMAMVRGRLMALVSCCVRSTGLAGRRGGGAATADEEAGAQAECGQRKQAEGQKAAL